MKYLIVDIGNTRAKLAVYDDLKLSSEIKAVEHERMTEAALAICHKYGVNKGMYSTVATPGLAERTMEMLQKQGVEMKKLNYRSKLSFKLDFPTLGADRIAAIVAGTSEFKNQDLLIIDAGTAITYEYITADGRYLGGNISPGLQMRFRALHAFTGLLPLAKAEDYDDMIGVTTNTAIAAGVVDGFKMEIEGAIDRFIAESERFSSKKAIILTGGDYKHLVLKVKSCIFARPNLVMDGIAAACVMNFGTQIG